MRKWLQQQLQLVSLPQQTVWATTHAGLCLTAAAQHAASLACHASENNSTAKQAVGVTSSVMTQPSRGVLPHTR